MTDRSELAAHYVPKMTVIIAATNDPGYRAPSSATRNYRTATLRALSEHAQRLPQQDRVQTVRLSEGVRSAARRFVVDDSSSRSSWSSSAW